jgi:hypothetical protein
MMKENVIRLKRFEVKMYCIDKCRIDSKYCGFKQASGSCDQNKEACRFLDREVVNEFYDFPENCS